MKDMLQVNGEQNVLALVNIGAIVVIPIGVRLNRPALRWPWWLLMTAAVLFVEAAGALARQGRTVLDRLDEQLGASRIALEVERQITARA